MPVLSNINNPPPVWLAQNLTRSLEQIGIHVLQNEVHPLKNKNNEMLFIVGIGPHYPDEDSPEAAFRQLNGDAPRIVFMHNPASFEVIPPNAAPLAVAGHTHGGQIRIPFLPQWSWLDIVQEREVHADGWIKNYGKKGNRLYVTRGVGFSYIPVRLNCPPELTFFTLN